MSKLVQRILGVTILAVFLLLAGCQLSGDGPAVPADASAIEAAIAVQNYHTPDLMAIPDVLGTATGVLKDGRPTLLVFARANATGLIPQTLGDLPVTVRTTSGFYAGEAFGEAVEGAGVVMPMADPTSRFNRPVPIGVSTGNRESCSSGTIGARVVDSQGRVFALSNNHVFALENTASPRSWIMQPGLLDSGCGFSSDNIVAYLAGFKPIKFILSGRNTVDAALARTTTDYLDNATPDDGYGLPKSETVLAAVGMNVQKYGRTTGHTTGVVTGINATMFVTYSAGIAVFDQQIIVEDAGAFILPGDSGSLLVTDPDRNPTGLLFAGNATGQLAIANPIQLVMALYPFTIDGE